MKPVLEAPRKRLGTASLVAFERKEKTFPWNWHYHPEMELTLIRRGHGLRLVGDHSEPYRRQDLVLLGANLPHTWASKDDGIGRTNRHQAIVVQFRPESLPEALLALPEFTIITQLLAAASRGLRFSCVCAEKIEAEMIELLQYRDIHRWLKLVKILETLAHHPAQILASARYHHRRFYQLSSRLDRVISHIEKHYRENINITDIAKVAGLTPGAFSRFFRKLTHRTFVSYRNSCRVREACRLLVETDLPVTEIAHECGFNNLANFNRRFLEEKVMVPRQYRRLYNPTSSSGTACWPSSNPPPN